MIHNIHDKFVRASFSDPKRAIAFFRTFLPTSIKEDLDLSSLRVLSESYMSAELKEYFSDLIFEVNLSSQSKKAMDVVLLFEHKSGPDKNLLFQLGHYLFMHWFSNARKGVRNKPIIPIVYYQGKKKWEPKGLKAYFKSYSQAILKYIPDVEFLFFDIQQLSHAQLSGIQDSLMAAAISAQQRRFNPITLAEDLKRIFSLFQNQDFDRNFFEMIIVYTLNTSTLSEAQLAESVENMPTQIKQNIMTTYDQLIEKGVQKGKAEGKLEGKIEGKLEGKIEGKQEGIRVAQREIILKGYDKGLSISFLASLSGLPKEEVKEIIQEHHKK